MSTTQESKRRFKISRGVRNLGVSALAFASVAGYSLYQRSASAADLNSASSSVNFSSLISTAPLATPSPNAAALYQDGEYQGDSVRADHWGNVQVTAVIENGQLTNIKILDYPHSRSMSQRIAQIAIPYLMQEAIQAQSASIDMISGATPTSQAFIASLQSALDSAATGTTATPTTPTTVTGGSSV